MDVILNTNKPVLVVGSGFSKRVNTEDYFVLSTGKALCNLDYADIVISLDLIRIIHNVSNFRKRWGVHLVPHRITNTQMFGMSSGIVQRKSGEIVYLRSPIHSLMFFDLDKFFSYNSPEGTFEGLNIGYDSISYEDVDKEVNFSKYKMKSFLREDTESIDDFAKEDGVLRNKCSSIHLMLNLLWLNGIKQITTLGISESHSNWGITKSIIDLYGIETKRLEDDTNIA